MLIGKCKIICGRCLVHVCLHLVEPCDMKMYFYCVQYIVNGFCLYKCFYPRRLSIKNNNFYHFAHYLFVYTV